jgi:hypothetical protein
LIRIGGLRPAVFDEPKPGSTIDIAPIGPSGGAPSARHQHE